MSNLTTAYMKDYTRCSQLIMAFSHRDSAPNPELTFIDRVVQHTQSEDVHCDGKPYLQVNYIETNVKRHENYKQK